MDVETHEKSTLPVERAQAYSTRMFLFALELIPIFGIPAVVGVLVSNKVRETYTATGAGTTFAILFVMYTLSWVVVLMRYRAVRKSSRS